MSLARRMTGWGFVAPFLAAFAFALIAPIGYAVYLSVFRQQLIGGNSFVGIANFHQALTDPKLWDGVGTVARFLAIQVPAMLLLALLAALALDSARLRWAPLYRLGIFLPYAVPGVVAALMWGYIYGNQFGLVARVSSALNVGLPNPLSGSWVLTAIGNIVTWEFAGYNMLILYAALRSVPGDLYEAAEIDGAGPIRTAISIKLPALRPALVVATLFSVIGSMQLFTEPQILQQLSPDTIPTTFTPNMYAYNLAFNGQEYNYAAAIAIIMGVLTVICAGLVQALGRRRMA
jgi:multiple sugar transport system permease protein